MTRLRGVWLAVIFLLAFVIAQDETNQTPSTESPPPDTTSQDDNSTLPFFQLKREDRTIIVQQTSTDSEGGIFASRKGCRKPDYTLTTVYAPSPKYVETTIKDTVIKANIVLREQPPDSKDKKERGQDKAILDMSGGTLEFDNDSVCPKNIKATATPDVILKQGRTTITGSTFLYDNFKGLGNMKGPVSLDRIAEGDSPALKANSDNLDFNVDTDQKILTGNVKLESEDRVSEADKLEYDEDNSIAVLYGNPAKSTKGEDVIQGNVIVYYLDTNDVKIVGDVQGTLTVNLGTTPADSGSDAAPTEDPDQ
jgi:lipopolysaccharide export system protein LptA